MVEVRLQPQGGRIQALKMLGIRVETVWSVLTDRYLSTDLWERLRGRESVKMYGGGIRSRLLQQLRLDGGGSVKRGRQPITAGVVRVSCADGGRHRYSANLGTVNNNSTAVVHYRQKQRYPNL